jgi:hypothetical protein
VFQSPDEREGREDAKRAGSIPDASVRLLRNRTSALLAEG